MNAPWAVVAAHPELLDPLEPLIDARRRIGLVQIAAKLAEVLPDAAAVLMVGGEPPRSAFANRADRRIPLGWVGTDAEPLRVFARTAAELISRQTRGLTPGPAVLLGQWDNHALLLADEVQRAAEVAWFRWTAERVARREMLEALRSGPGAALYLGHALCGGWVGYGGITAVALSARRMQPLGAVLTVASDAARCHPTRPSFCDDLVMRGACSAALGAVGKSRRETDRVLARSIARSFSKGHTLGELLQRIPEDALQGYRIAGDPAAPLIGSAQAWEMVGSVRVPTASDVAPELATVVEDEGGAAIAVRRYRSGTRPGSAAA